MSKGKVKDAQSMPSGGELELGNWEVQIDETMKEESFRSAVLLVGLRQGIRTTSAAL